MSKFKSIVIRGDVLKNKTGLAVALIAWSVIFYTSVCVYAFYIGKTNAESSSGIGLAAISLAVFIPLFGIAYGAMASIMGRGGYLLCFANAVFSSALICVLCDFDEIYGRIAVCAFIGAAVFSFTALVKTICDFFPLMKKYFKRH